MFRVLSTAALALLLSTSAFGQLASQTGLIGTVTDSNGGVLPGATVTAVNVGTQTTLSGVTNEAGVYQFNAVPLGAYEITISLAGVPDLQGDEHRGRRQPGRSPGCRPERGRSERDDHRRSGEHDDPDRPRHRVADRRGARRHRPAVAAAATSGRWPRRRPACSAGRRPTSACRSAAPASARSRTA